MTVPTTFLYTGTDSMTPAHPADLQYKTTLKVTISYGCLRVYTPHQKAAHSASTPPPLPVLVGSRQPDTFPLESCPLVESRFPPPYHYSNSLLRFQIQTQRSFRFLTENPTQKPKTTNTNLSTKHNGNCLSSFLILNIHVSTFQPKRGQQTTTTRAQMVTEQERREQRTKIKEN